MGACGSGSRILRYLRPFGQQPQRLGIGIVQVTSDLIAIDLHRRGGRHNAPWVTRGIVAAARYATMRVERSLDQRGSLSIRPAPREHLDPKARTLWRLSGLLAAAPLVLVAAGIAWGLLHLGIRPAFAALPVMAALVIVVVGVMLVPDLLYRHWRYEIGEEEVDLQYGLVTFTRTLIPMTRIQHVDTRRGPLQRRFGLASVILYTAAGASEIPALADAVADGVRDRIAALANTRDDL